MTLATGVYPIHHGIVGNDWSELSDGEWRRRYLVEDPEAPILGYPEMGGRSPVNMFRDGLPDWIAAANPDARIVSISRKDRAAIALAVRARGDVYWLSPTAGEFITSSFYHSTYPDWVRRFNQEEMPEIYSDTVWESATPPEYYALSRPDTSAYELDGVNTFFPHRASDTVDPSHPAEVNDWRYEVTPFPDLAVLRLAEAAIQELELGQRSGVDYLGLSFSQTDLVGHKFGPFSREQLDNLLRLDAVLGELLTVLDGTIGPGGWVLALSSDHGVLEVPEHMIESGRSAARLDRDDRAALNESVAQALESGLEGEALTDALQASMSALPFIEQAYTFRQVEDPTLYPDTFAVLFGRSHLRNRALSLPQRYGIHIRYPPNTIDWGSNRATHGSPYLYDRAVPLIFLGGGIQAGQSTEVASTTDVAPTLATLAGLDHPGDLDGRDLSSYLRP